MSACPACGQPVRPLWPTCRACGALLMAAPAPVVPVGAPAPSGPSPEEQFFAPAVMQTAYVAPPESFAPSDRGWDSNSGARSDRGARGGSSADAGKWMVLVAMIGFFAVAIGLAWFTMKPKADAKHATPVVLAPRAPTAGLPTDLGVIVRVEAESARHTALQAVEHLGNGDVAALAATQPAYHWITGDRASTDSHTVSVSQRADESTIAVAASNHDVCAFGTWSAHTGVAQYVTMGHEPTCAAVNAPVSGWTNQPGGAGSDLPDDLNS